MNRTTAQTRAESNSKVNKNLREMQVLTILAECVELTAKQVARQMKEKGFIKEVDYNHARPRLTSLLEKREVCIIGKLLDRETNCKEVIYQITQKGRERINAKN